MKTVLKHIEYVKGKPHHIRKRIAFAVSAAAAALVALVWFAGSLGTGAFAIAGNSFSESASGTSAVATDSTAGNSNLAGAAAALPSASAPAHIEIVDTAPSAPAKSRSEQTTIPF